MAELVVRVTGTPDQLERLHDGEGVASYAERNMSDLPQPVVEFDPFDATKLVAEQMEQPGTAVVGLPDIPVADTIYERIRELQSNTKEVWA